MLLPKVTIADGEFLPYGKSESIGGDNAGIGPTYFEWEQAEPDQARFVTDRYIKHAKGEGQVAWLLESFFLHPENYIAAMEKNFDAVITHNQYFVRNQEWLWCPHGGSWIDFNQWGLHPKTRNVSLIASDKKSMRGHRLRHEVIEEYGQHLDVVFGIPERTRKFDCLADFRYSVVIESEKCPYFFSEKLIDCLSVGTIPIYWGCPGVGDFFTEEGIIVVDSLYEIGRELEKFSDRKYAERYYNEVIPYIQYNVELAKQFRFSEDYLWNHYRNLF